MIVINITKAKEIAKDINNTKLNDELVSFNELITKYSIGMSIAEMDAKRKEIIDKYEAIQEEITSSKNTEEIKAILNI